MSRINPLESFTHTMFCSCSSCMSENSRSLDHQAPAPRAARQANRVSTSQAQAPPYNSKKPHDISNMRPSFTFESLTHDIVCTCSSCFIDERSNGRMPQAPPQATRQQSRSSNSEAPPSYPTRQTDTGSIVSSQAAPPFQSRRVANSNLYPQCETSSYYATADSLCVAYQRAQRAELQEWALVDDMEALHYRRGHWESEAGCFTATTGRPDSVPMGVVVVEVVQSARATQGGRLSLNVDVATSVFWSAGSVLDIVAKHLRCDCKEFSSVQLPRVPSVCLISRRPMWARESGQRAIM
ncbi:hypothetical protein BJ508DRAFT_380744 [Ascobolus immersus RN42]|uniref:Argonaute linker 1 domain-containing protein n=1 Tax=Ascobolus immersus RN42 TaxID=1160509 RepID=A0A3N4HMK4_ASCIM|nr:hypothetical protein BJ508DRAFT_380744 [Ascobolus immersus RN42]